MSDRAWKTLAGVAGALTAVGVGALVYGALVESNRLVVRKRTLPLPGWPDALRGYRIALLGDFHLGTKWDLALTKRAIAAAMAEAPDMVVIIGDIVSYWHPGRAAQVGEALESLRLLKGDVIAIAGNHEYYAGNADLLAPILEELNIHFLRNRSMVRGGITWVGIDSARTRHFNIEKAFRDATDDGTPRLVLWHEPDMVELLPSGCALQLSGHSHGGQFRFPFGYAPVHPPLGSKHTYGYFPDLSTPLYVTSGVGTTGPPSRFLCTPEVVILKLVPG